MRKSRPPHSVNGYIDLGTWYRMTPNPPPRLSLSKFGDATTGSDPFGSMTIKNVAAHEVRVGLRGVSMIFLAGTKANAIGGCARRFGAAVVLSALSIVAVGASKAADWPDMTAPLRGTISPPMRWDGVNFGVQLGVSNMNTDFGNSTSDLVAYSLRNTVVENEFAPSK